jgi:hypothetical protein
MYFDSLDVIFKIILTGIELENTLSLRHGTGTS